MQIQPECGQLLVHRMSQLAEAIDPDNDWTGLHDAVARWKRQNRLNLRAYRKPNPNSLFYFPLTCSEGEASCKPHFHTITLQAQQWYLKVDCHSGMEGSRKSYLCSAVRRRHNNRQYLL